MGNVRNELIRGETCWSTFEERKAKAIVKWMLRVVFKVNLMSGISRACLIETVYKLRWWAQGRNICSKFGLMELVNLIWLRYASVNEMVNLGFNVTEKIICMNMKQ